MGGKGRNIVPLINSLWIREFEEALEGWALKELKGIGVSWLWQNLMPTNFKMAVAISKCL